MRPRMALLLILLMLVPGACAPTSLTLMTFNIRYANPADGVNSWDNRHDLVTDVIESVAPDVLGIQEALHAQLLFLEGRLPEYGRVGVGRDDGVAAGEFAPIFYRSDALTLIESGTFWFSETPETPETPGSTSYGNSITRICTWARFETVHRRRTLLVANVHLDHQSAESRLESARQLRRWIDRRAPDEPVIVLGDFNCTPESAPMRVFLDDGWSTAIRDDAAQGTYHAFTGEARDRIDLILVPTGTEVTDGAIITRGGDEGIWPSDHFPVWSRIRLDSHWP